MSVSEIPTSLLEVNKGPRLTAILSVITALATISFGLRIAVKSQRQHSLALDDWFAFAAFIILWGGYVVAILMVKLGGLGRPEVVNLAIDPNRLIIDEQLLYAAEPIYGTVMAMIKLSFLALYWRIFPTRFMKLGCIILGSITTALWLAFVLVCLFQCSPIYKAWDPYLLTGHCINNSAFFLGFSIPNTVVEIFILFLPIQEVRHLQLPRAQRLGLASIFLLGGGDIAFGVVRLYYNLVLLNQGDSADYTIALYNPVMWTYLEPCIGLICCCLPTLRPVVTMFTSMSFMRSFRSFFSYKSSYGSSNFKQAAMGIETIGGTPISGDSNKAPYRHLVRSVEELEDQQPLSHPEQPLVLWPNNYSSGQSRTTIGGNQGCVSRERNDIHLDVIRVQTSVQWQETSQRREL